jgi:beta-N-acetylhexosaminidase
VMICHTMSAQVGAIEQVIEAVRSGELSQDAIQASVNRVKSLKARYLSWDGSIIPKSTLVDAETRNARQFTFASEMYAKTTTVVRSQPQSFPISKDPRTKIVFISPGKTPVGGGAAGSGEEKTRVPYTPASYIDVLQSQNSSIKDIRFLDSVPLSRETEKDIEEAEVVIFATRNASLSKYQKDVGLSLGKKLGKKLVVIATCDPYDFLGEVEEVKNYITIYEPTISAFKSAVDVIFGNTQGQGKLPVGLPPVKHDIRRFHGSDEEVKKISNMWQEIFPEWPVSPTRLAKILRNKTGQHFFHEGGFCLSFIADRVNGKIACIGVLKAHRGKGVGTALLKKAQEELKHTVQAAGNGYLKTLQVGSAFPRFWPEVPNTFSPEAKDFFIHRGMFILQLQ